jgi:hypothetical protein
MAKAQQRAADFLTEKEKTGFEQFIKHSHAGHHAQTSNLQYNDQLLLCNNTEFSILLH